MASRDSSLAEMMAFAKSAEKALGTLKEKQVEILKERDKIEGELKTLQSPEKIQKLVVAAFEGAKAGALDYVKQSIYEAVGKNREFSDPLFLTPLLKAAESPELLTFSLIGTGYSAQMTVSSMWNAVAGDLSDYSRAITEVRESLNLNANNDDPVLASIFWKKIIYGTAKQQETVSARLQHADSVAPFWSILDQGAPLTMDSSWGGFPYPVARKTDFVSNYQVEIVREFETLKQEKKVLAQQAESNLKIILKTTDEVISTLDADLEEISQLAAKNSSLEEKIQRLYSMLEKKGKKIDFVKLERAAYEAEFGMGTRKYIDLTPAGAKRRSNIRFSTLIRELGG